VDGLHQAMPRTFAEKAQLQQVHFLDPEDLLRAEAAFVERLPNEEYRTQNERALAALQAVGLDYRYARISMEESYYAKEDLKNWNNDMALWQKLKQRSAQVKPTGGDDDIMIDTEDEVSETDIVTGEDE
jgi:hypothetical protein